MPASDPLVESLSDLVDARLHVVTGKGGVGKTSVAAALALALAAAGKRVLLVEVEGRQGLSQTFDVPPLGTDEVRLVSHPGGGELWGLSVDAKAALLEYLQLFYKLGRAGSALEKVGAIDFATTIAPGVRDVLLIGKVYEAAGRPSGGRGSVRGSSRAARASGNLHYDAVVLDAPPTGRAVRFLNVNEGVADVAKMGPIKSQAESITRMLRDRSTVVHMVTLLEEMPVQESLDGLRDLEAAGLHLGALIVNQVRSPHLTAEQRTQLASGEDLEDLVRSELTLAGLKPTNPMVKGLIAEGRDHTLRLDLQDEMAGEILAAGPPVIELPAMPGGLEGGGVGVLADELAAVLLGLQEGEA